MHLENFYMETENVLYCFVIVDASKFQYQSIENKNVKFFLKNFEKMRPTILQFWNIVRYALYVYLFLAISFTHHFHDPWNLDT